MVGRTRHEGGDGRGKGFAVIIVDGDVGAGGSAQPVNSVMACPASPRAPNVGRSASCPFRLAETVGRRPRKLVVHSAAFVGE
jgi:hypothetical protein